MYTEHWYTGINISSDLAFITQDLSTLYQSTIDLS